MSAPLLIELQTEELPPKALQALAAAFAKALLGGLQDAGLTDPGVDTTTYATPRRLALLVASVRTQAPPREVRTKGPSVAVGLGADGQPTMALQKWAAKQGARIEDLVREQDGKQENFVYRSVVNGATLAQVVEGLIRDALAKLPIPKLMTYQLADGTTTVSFVRPAHRLVVLHDADVLPARVLGLDADRVTVGHRFLSNGPVSLARATDYADALQAAQVIADFDARKARIAGLLAAASEAEGAHLSVSDTEAAQAAALLDEVTALVEWPAVYVGRFEEAFLAVPQECLILSMRTNQRYFPLFDAQGRLLNRFLIVSNMAIDDPSTIIDGNERVVRPRLADARFFFDQDRRQTLDERTPRLASVVYHARLGTQADRVARVTRIGAAIAAQLGIDSALVERAARLAKADLLTGMVGEFPELQGVMGRYYAGHDGEPPAVADAIAEHYQPRYAGDALPATPTGTALALADKLETLAGIWGIGSRPTGDRDPFALRRHALGVIRMLFEKQLSLDLTALLTDAFAVFDNLPAPAPATPPAPAASADAKAGVPAKAGARAAPKAFEADVAGLAGFIGERLRGYLRERGFEPGDVDAALAVDGRRLDRLEARLVAIASFRQLPEFDALAAANKRIANLLRKSSEVEAAADQIDPALLVEPAEKALFDAMVAAEPVVDGHLRNGNDNAALASLAALRGPVDAYFDGVMVNAPDPALRTNRLTMLRRLARLMNRVADLSLL